ncbi:hypothetical protein OC835_007839, partial [Tilletia horrida]
SGYGRYTIKVSEPGKFHGDGDPREWVEEVRDYIGFHNLRGPPMGQNEQQLKKLHVEDPNHPALQFTLSQFLEWVQREFKDVNREEKDRTAYVRCAQGHRTVAKYVTDFLARAARVLPPLTALDMRDRFKDGLSPEMRREMARVRPTPMDPREYMSVAEELDQTIRAAEAMTRPERTSHPDRFARGALRGGNRPSTGFARPAAPERSDRLMALPEVEASDNGSASEYSDGENSERASEEGSETELAAIGVENLRCYQCQNVGHIARDCPRRVKGRMDRKESGKGKGRA